MVIREAGPELSLELECSQLPSGFRDPDRFDLLPMGSSASHASLPGSAFSRGGRAMRPDGFDPRWAGAIVMRNAEVEETGLGAGVLNQPARGVAWLANRLGQYGQSIEAGQIVLSGSFIRPVEARPGDTILADFGPMGTVGCFFA
jgi:2-keto-4-pentenoate hydratase